MTDRSIADKIRVIADDLPNRIPGLLDSDELGDVDDDLRALADELEAQEPKVLAEGYGLCVGGGRGFQQWELWAEDVTRPANCRHIRIVAVEEP